MYFLNFIDDAYNMFTQSFVLYHDIGLEAI